VVPLRFRVPSQFFARVRLEAGHMKRCRYRELRPFFSAGDLVPLVRAHPDFIDSWVRLCEDKRTSAGWWVGEDFTIGRMTPRHEVSAPFPSMEEAVAEYVIRELDFWSSVGMNRTGLELILDALGIPKAAYFIGDGMRGECYFLTRDSRGRWCTYYSERGAKVGIKYFDSESEACEHLLTTLRPLAKGRC
jgi:hypothetical protein